MIQPGSSTGKGFWSHVDRGVHLLERGVQVAGTLRAGYSGAMALAALI